MGVTDLSSKLGAKFMFAGTAARSPFFIRPILNKVRDAISQLALDPEIEDCIKFVEKELEGREWLMGGDAPSRPDFVLHYSVGMAIQSKYVDPKKYPNVAAWMDRCEARDAWKRSLEKGNGYNIDYPSQF